jgi:hypothetical protein
MRKDIRSRLRATTTFLALSVTASFLGLAVALPASAATPASVTISDPTVTEVDAGATVQAVFTVKVSRFAKGSVSFATANGTAKAPGDYLPKSGVLKLNGKGSKKISVTVVGDAADEFDETFFVRLSNPRNIIIADGEGMGTIVDNDPLPTVAGVDSVVPEANAGQSTVASIDVTLTGATEKTVHVDYATADGSATAPDDYASTAGSLTFAPGQTVQTVQVPVAGDDAVEGNESFALNLSNADEATIGHQATVTIQDNDVPAPATMSIDDVSIKEGDKGVKALTFTVSISQSVPASVDFGTASGSAAAASDYLPANGHLDFVLGGVTSQTVAISVVGDLPVEHDEDFFVNLLNVSGAQLVKAQGVGTIRDNDTRTRLLRVWKRYGRIRVRGLMTPAHPGKRMIVRLYRYANGRWVRLSTHRPYLYGSSDVNLDGFMDSRFRTTFLRPRPGTCKVVAIFPGDIDHRRSSASKKISC